MIPAFSFLRSITVGLALLVSGPVVAAAASASVAYRLQLDTISDGYDGQMCWFHPRAGAIPGPTPTVVLTMQRWNLKRSDVFYPVVSLQSSDLGATWSPIVEHKDTLGRHRLDATREEAICDFTPKWHAASGKLIGTGHTVFYANDVLMAVRPRHTVWSVYEPATRAWTAWAKLEMPAEPRFANAGAGSTQRVDLANGDLLLPIYAKAVDAKTYLSTVMRCRFDGKKLTYIEHGTELTVGIDRGLYEPSLAKFGDRYFLTMRNDQAAYIARSDDGLRFDAAKKWTFDDGADLGSYNTQAALGGASRTAFSSSIPGAARTTTTSPATVRRCSWRRVDPRAAPSRAAGERARRSCRNKRRGARQLRHRRRERARDVGHDLRGNGARQPGPVRLQWPGVCGPNHLGEAEPGLEPALSGSHPQHGTASHMRMACQSGASILLAGIGNDIRFSPPASRMLAPLALPRHQRGAAIEAPDMNSGISSSDLAGGRRDRFCIAVVSVANSCLACACALQE
jgi:hypothetical protein